MREKKIISAMVLPKYVPKKCRLTYPKLGTDLTEIIKKKKERIVAIVLSIVARNATFTNYFIIFLQIVVMANFLLVLMKACQ